MTTAARLLTLAWDDRRGRIPMGDSTAVQHAIAGADLADALAAGAVTLDGDRVHVADARATSEDAATATAIAGVVAAVERRRRPPKARDLVSKVASTTRTRRAVDELVTAGTLRVVPRRWWVFDLPPAHHLEDPDGVAAQRDHIAHVLQGHATADGLDATTRAAVALLAATALIRRFVDRSERKAARKRAHDLVDDPAVGDAVRRAIEAAEAAVTAAVVAGGAAAAGSG